MVGWPEDEPIVRTTNARPMAEMAATQITTIRAGFIQGLRRQAVNPNHASGNLTVNDHEGRELTLP